ncbi:PQQ-like beta-propeller repeat protein [bacterium]|nr:PQQ-like beta-propeller repeat protein [bacterium]
MKRNSLWNSPPFLIACVLILISIIYIPEVSSVDGVSPTAEDDRANAAHYWPQWRGPLGIGVAPSADPPLEWSEKKNIRWKVKLPGKGHSTPVIWGDRIFLTAAIPYGDPISPRFTRPGSHDDLALVTRQRFVVLAVNRRDGKILWQRTVREDTPFEGGHYSGSFASASAVTDGRHVYAFFGSYGLYCLDLEGKLKWQTDLGDMHTLHGHGEGSSPALYSDTLIVNWDHEGSSFVIALDKRTGKQRWKMSRDEITSWSTPLVIEQNGRPQVIISATNRIRGYDLASGRLIWECGGLSHNVIASPVAARGIVYAGSSYEKRAMLAIRLDGAKGDITGTKQIVWSRDRDTPYVPSLLLYNDKLYFLKHYQGILSCLKAKTGDTIYGPVRLPGIYNVYSSPVGAAGRVYITSMEGSTIVLKHGAKPEVLALNVLDDNFNASPALVGNELFLRGEQYLYCIAGK